MGELAATATLIMYCRQWFIHRICSEESKYYAGSFEWRRVKVGFTMFYDISGVPNMIIVLWIALGRSIFMNIRITLSQFKRSVFQNVTVCVKFEEYD